MHQVGAERKQAGEEILQEVRNDERAQIAQSKGDGPVEDAEEADDESASDALIDVNGSEENSCEEDRKDQSGSRRQACALQGSDRLVQQITTKDELLAEGCRKAHHRPEQEINWRNRE